MTQRDLDVLNRRIEMLYRSRYLQEPEAGIARKMGLSISCVEKGLVKARLDRRALDGASRMAAARKESSENAEFE